MHRRWDGYYWVVAGPEVKEHPLVARLKSGVSLGWVHEHKYVLYGKIGPGPHPCTYCGKLLYWESKPQLQVDHVDDDRDNNAPDNLVPSCVQCNTDRGRRISRRDVGIRDQAKSYVCRRCGKECKTKASLRGHSSWCGDDRRQKMIEAFRKRAALKKQNRGPVH